MKSAKVKSAARERRRLRIRRNVKGTAEKPRLVVHKSLNHIYVQIVDDDEQTTLLAASSLSKELRAELATGGNVEAARAVGRFIGARAVEKGIRKVVFDRGGYIYHGRVKALAEAAREAGLEL